MHSIYNIIEEKKEIKKSVPGFALLSKGLDFESLEFALRMCFLPLGRRINSLHS